MFSHFFIDRPIFATVLSIVIVLIGGVGVISLPIAQYPDVTPPTVSVTGVYPGASAQVVADTVASPIEQEVNGVEDMLYMQSRSTNDGAMALDVTFELGTDIDFAQVLTQNRVSIAEAQLPDEVKRQGVTTKKKSPSILMVVNLVSPDGRYDQLYMSNYATINIRDALARVKGVGDVSLFGARDYSMRIWLDPDQLASRNLTAGDVVRALQEQNVQVAAGRIGQPPVPTGQQFQLTINTQGRLLEAHEFDEVVIKTASEGQIVYLKDVGRTELGAQSYDVDCYLNGQPSVGLAVFQLPGSNALSTAEAVRQRMQELKTQFPEGLDYAIKYDTTIFVDESIHEVYKTLFEAILLVFIVVLVFLQDWRATIIPMIAVPVSLVGTFAVMSLLGFSINNLSLFGLVLAIGIVVDDAIVVVENFERWLAEGLSPRDAARRAMEEVSGPVIAIALVLSSVFIPTAFITGISGQFYRQFALTIAASTLISAFNSLTLSPALCVLLFKGPSEAHGRQHAKQPLPPLGVGLLGGVLLAFFGEHWAARIARRFVDDNGDSATHAPWWFAPLIIVALFIAGVVAGLAASGLVNRLLSAFFRAFNAAFDWFRDGYVSTTRQFLRLGVFVMLIYAGMMVLAYLGFRTVPVGFVPPQDKGYLIATVQLQDGASLERTSAVVQELTKIALETDGVDAVNSIPGYSAISAVNLSNSGTMFIVLDPFEVRAGVDRLYDQTLAIELTDKFNKNLSARTSVFGAPPIEGLGNTGGFKLQVQDRGDRGPFALQEAVTGVARAAMETPEIFLAFSSYSANQPQLFVDIDREKAKNSGVEITSVNQTLQAYLGSAYVNDFTRFGRNWQVNVQADALFRLQPEDIGRLKTRNAAGQMVPLAGLLTVREISGPAVVNRYNMFPSAEVTGVTRPGVSSGQAIATMERIAGETLPSSMGFEWTELTLLQILAGNTAVFVFGLGALFVFLVLAAQYESWSLPLAIILIVPMCLLAAIAGVWIAGMENNIFTQIGLVVLIGLAAKNAILIVEFAKQQQDANMNRRDAALEAAKLRLRPILMTSLAFILGVVPLVLGVGAGAEMRNALGVAVFSGMIGVTIFGPFFTPAFYVLIRGLVERNKHEMPSNP
jgi:multidrug efflux pump